jgi:hypothetical protein
MGRLVVGRSRTSEECDASIRIHARLSTRAASVAWFAQCLVPPISQDCCRSGLFSQTDVSPPDVRAAFQSSPLGITPRLNSVACAGVNGGSKRSRFRCMQRKRWTM